MIFEHGRGHNTTWEGGAQRVPQRQNRSPMSTETLNDDALLRVSQLTSKPGKPGLLGVSRSSLYRLLEAGKFPKPVRPLDGVVAWRAGDVRNWLRSHSQDQGGAA